jgi:xylan 1,4-beta-xylosidase
VCVQQHQPPLSLNTHAIASSVIASLARALSHRHHAPLNILCIAGWRSTRMRYELTNTTLSVVQPPKSDCRRGMERTVLVVLVAMTSTPTCTCGDATTQSRYAEVEPLAVDVTVNTMEVSPFVHTWKRSWGSGHAALTLRDDWRQHLKMAVHDLGLQGVRYHGLFDDDQGPVVTAPGVYNFTLLDSTWDYMTSLGVKPIVELSFMPAWIAGCAWTGKVGGPTSSSPTITVNPTAKPCTAGHFRYKGISAPPANGDYEPWYDLVKATVSHAVERYGVEEIRSWSFEVWNELWGMPFRGGDYMRLYNASAHAVKAVDSQIRVGGPATAQLGDVPEFVAACKEMNAPFDFVSTHHYPTDPQCPKGEDQWDPDCFTNNVRACRKSAADVPFYLTEYNVGCCLGYHQHDTPAAAPFVFRQIGELSQQLDVMSYVVPPLFANNDDVS